MLRTKFCVLLVGGLAACGVGSLPSGNSGDSGDSGDGGSTPLDSGQGVDSSADATPADSAAPDGSTEDAAGDAADGGGPADPCPYSDWVGDACAPVCGTANFGSPGLIDGGPDLGLVGVVQALSVYDTADSLFSVTADGTVLHSRALNNTQWELLLSVPSAVSSDGYLTSTLFDQSKPNQPPFASEGSFLLTFDGSTFITTKGGGAAVVQAPIQGAQVGALSDALFAAVNVIPAGASITLRAIAPDGLSLYYVLANTPSPAQSGIYVATRTDAHGAFSAGTMLPADIQSAFMWVTGVSWDNLTGFFTDYNFNLHVLRRASPSDPWSATVDGSATPAIPYYPDAIPTADCRFLFTDCTPGGEWATEICVIPRL